MASCLVLLPEQQRFDHLCEKISAALTGLGLTSEDLLATLPRARKRVYARRYGKPTRSTKSSARRQRKK
jgi:hypothetical protein